MQMLVEIMHDRSVGDEFKSKTDITSGWIPLADEEFSKSPFNNDGGSVVLSLGLFNNVRDVSLGSGAASNEIRQLRRTDVLS